MNEAAKLGLLAALELTRRNWKKGDPVPAGMKVQYAQQPPHQGAKECRRRQRQLERAQA